MNQIIVFIISVGDIEYSQYSEKILTRYFTNNCIDFMIVKNDYINPKKAHPSWIKLLSHKYINDDRFILCWDLDLLPVNQEFNMFNHLDLSKINACIDTSLLQGCEGFNKNFRYNCGLIGIPYHERTFFEHVYEKHAPGVYPSYEQYYVNDELVNVKKDVNVLPSIFNLHYPINNENIANRHYTWGTYGSQKIELIKNHYEQFT